MKKRIIVIGAGLCGSLLSTLLRNDFRVTVVERGRKKRPLFDDIDCDAGELNTSINRAEGLGGTTNYWHNALIELDDKDLAKAGIDAHSFKPYYQQGWELFLSQRELDDCNRARDANAASLRGGVATIAHMVLPQTRHNAWELANRRYPGDDISVVYGRARRVVPGGVELEDGTRLASDAVIVCAGGIGTPVLLAHSLEHADGFVPGYHDHPMAYVAKIKLRADSRLKKVSSTATMSADVRAGLIYEADDLKTVVYLRPAVDLRLGSITGPARYILSDLRNDPFSPKKIMMLLGNLEAVREAILFKTRLGFRGDYYSVLILGEQTPLATRGIAMASGRRPSLNWHVTPEELRSYDRSLAAFYAEHATDIVEQNVLPASQWEFRNAAHHSGTATSFLAANDPPPHSLIGSAVPLGNPRRPLEVPDDPWKSPTGDGGRGTHPGDPWKSPTTLGSPRRPLEVPDGGRGTGGRAGIIDMFRVSGLQGTYVCDGSILRAAGIANSGLTLVALTYRLAELLRAAV